MLCVLPMAPANVATSSSYFNGGHRPLRCEKWAIPFASSGSGDHPWRGLPRHPLLCLAIVSRGGQMGHAARVDPKHVTVGSTQAQYNPNYTWAELARPD